MRFFILVSVLILPLFFIGCLEGPTAPAPTSPVKSDSTPTAPVAAGTACNFTNPSPVLPDSLVGDFNPLQVGNEWVFAESLVYTSDLGYLYHSTRDTGSVTLSLIRSECKDSVLEHQVRVQTKLIETYTTGRDGDATPPSHPDSTVNIDKEVLVVCEETRSGITCSASSDIPLALGPNFVATYFTFAPHLIAKHDLVQGIDPFAGNKVVALYKSSNTSGASLIYYRDVGLVSWSYFSGAAKPVADIGILAMLNC